MFIAWQAVSAYLPQAENFSFQISAKTALKNEAVTLNTKPRILIHAIDAYNKTQRVPCVFRFKMRFAMQSTVAWPENSLLSLRDPLIYLHHGNSIFF